MARKGEQRKGASFRREPRLTRHVRFSLTPLNISQHPPVLPLRHELPAQDTILGEVHVSSEHVGVLAVQRLALKVLAQGAMARLVVLQGVVSVRAQRSGQHRNIPEHTLERFIENVGHLVLKVLRRHQRIEQVAAEAALHGLDLAASAGHVGVCVKGLPQMVQ